MATIAEIKVLKEWRLDRCGLWDPIPHRGILPEPRHTGVGLGPIPKDMKDTDNTLWEVSPSRGSRKDM